MQQEIERKYLLTSLPSTIDQSLKVTYERHYLSIGPNKEVRVQRKGSEFFRETKTTNVGLSSDKEVSPITAEQFNQLRQKSIGSIVRDSYVLPGIKNATVKVYHGQLEGLIRAEVEFSDAESAANFTPPDWFGVEITDTNLGRDGRLVRLSVSEFSSLLKEVSRKH